MMTEQFIKHVEIDIHDGIVETYLNHPPHNYLTLEVINELLMLNGFLSAAERAGKVEIRGIIISGKGRVFSGGASLDMLADLKTAEAQAELSDKTDELMGFLEEASVPVIAAINGICLGAGLETALACHHRICGKGVLLGLPEIKLGLIPGAGGTQRLARLIGRSQAQYLILSGKFITAEEALKLGIVDAVVPRKEVVAVARKFAEEICRQDRKATACALRAIRTGLRTSIDEGRRVEKECFWRLVDDRLAERGMSEGDLRLDFSGRNTQARSETASGLEGTGGQDEDGTGRPDRDPAAG